MYYLKTNKYDSFKSEFEKYESLRSQALKIEEESNQHKLDMIGHFYISLAENNLSLEEAKYLRLKSDKRHTDLLLWMSLGGGILFTLGIAYFFLEKQRRNKYKNRLLKAEKENLDISLQLKQKDLSKASLDLTQRTEVINDFLSKFKRVESESPETVKARVVEELKRLKQFNSSRKTLDKFLKHTEVVNSEFYDKLNALHPNLTQNETDLCAYLMLDLSTKDIANLQGILPGSVRMNKMRLKKKLNVQEPSLEDYLKKVFQ